MNEVKRYLYASRLNKLSFVHYQDNKAYFLLDNPDTRCEIEKQNGEKSVYRRTTVCRAVEVELLDVKKDDIIPILEHPRFKITNVLLKVIDDGEQFEKICELSDFETLQLSASDYENDLSHAILKHKHEMEDFYRFLRWKHYGQEHQFSTAQFEQHFRFINQYFLEQLFFKLVIKGFQFLNSNEYTRGHIGTPSIRNNIFTFIKFNSIIKARLWDDGETYEFIHKDTFYRESFNKKIKPNGSKKKALKKMSKVFKYVDSL